MRDQGGYGPGSFAPVKEGDTLDVKIEAVGEKGDGIAKKDGFVLFVPNTHEGDEVKIKINRVLRRVGFAEVVGKADGPVAAQEKRKPMARPAPEEQQESKEFGGEEQSSEDTDDFGDDDSEEKTDEE